MEKIKSFDGDAALPRKKKGQGQKKSTDQVRLRKLKGDGLRPYPMPKNEACSVKTVQDTESSSQCLLGARVDPSTAETGVLTLHSCDDTCRSMWLSGLSYRLFCASRITSFLLFDFSQLPGQKCHKFLPFHVHCS